MPGCTYPSPTHAMQVGFVQTMRQPERRSGAEAWSLRAHDFIEEMTYAEFVDAFRQEDIPFHRIAYFKQLGAIVW